MWDDTANSSKSWKQKKTMKTGTTTGDEDDEEGVEFICHTNCCSKAPVDGAFLFQRLGGQQLAMTALRAILQR